MIRRSRIGILTGGGDCAGLNPAIKWVVKTALDERLEQERSVRYEVLGIREGWEGLVKLEPDLSNMKEWIVPLDQEMVRTWDRYGGTQLGTSRTNPYNPRKDQSRRVIENIRNLELEALITIGGDDTQSVSYKLSQEGIQCIGIPKTIDKDLPGTDYTLGFETSVNIITEEVDRLRTTAGSHRRLFVVETMGRHAGWLSLEGGESSGAFIILIPEYDFSMERVYELVVEGRKAGARYDIIVCAEGAKPQGYTEFTKGQAVDSFGHRVLGGIGDFVADSIEKSTGMETRCVVLSHLQRGGVPCAYDRRMGRYFGIAAVDLVVVKKYGNMVCFRNGQISYCPLKEATGPLSLVDINKYYDTDRYNGRRSILGREG